MASNSATHDPYLAGPNYNVLKNLVGATTPEELAAAESELFHARVIQLRDHNLVPPTRDAEEIKGLHRHLFQDVYEWAGEYRTIDMRRGVGEHFAPRDHIPYLVENVMAKLAEREQLSGLRRETFVREITELYDELNFIHPFREGNGRMQRTFWARVSFSAGWILDWRPIHGQELDETSRIAREEGNSKPLYQALDKCIAPLSPE